MQSTKYKIGDFVEPINIKLGKNNNNNVLGININKKFFPSKNFSENREKYLLVPPNYFACNLMHIGRDEMIPIALNTSNDDVVVSPAYNVFKISNEKLIIKEFLNIFVNTPEFDRYAWFCTDSSVRGNMDWETFCDIEISIPSVPIQEKFVETYLSVSKKINNYEVNIKNLKKFCDYELEKLIKKKNKIKLNGLIKRHTKKNTDNKIKNVKGVSVTQEFRDPTSKVNLNSLSNYKIVKPRHFSYVPANDTRKLFSYAFNDTHKDIVVSYVNEVFSTDESKLLPEFLCIFLARKEFDRYARFHSWGTAREVFTWEDLLDVEIPNLKINDQKNLANIYKIYLEKKSVQIKLLKTLENLNPILLKGSLN
jgi:type I restriction enzyme, S subunit